jgi:plastocyanin
MGMGGVLLLMLALSGSAEAGEVSGVVRATALESETSRAQISIPDPDDDVAIVWLEELKERRPPSKHLHISQKGVHFLPSLLVVVAGQSVDMPNDDDVAHNVFSYSPVQKFNLGLYPKGEARTVTFEKPGVVDLYCSIHRQMRAKILVVPNSHYVRVGLGTRYALKDVPAGTYTLKVWNRRLALHESQVVVPAKGKAQADVELSAAPKG